MKEHENELNLRMILKQNGENCTIHGISRIVSSSNTGFRLIWICLFFGVNGYLIFQLSNLFAAYYKWPMKTSVSLEFSKLQFPAITFCNMNPIRKSRLSNASTKIQSLLNPTLAHTNVRKKRSASGSGSSTSSSASSTDSLINSYSVFDTTPASQYSMEITPTPSLESATQSTAVPSSVAMQSSASDVAPSYDPQTNTNGYMTCVSADGSTYYAGQCSTGHVEYTSSSYTNWWDWYRDSESFYNPYSDTAYGGSSSGYSGYYSSGYSSSYDYYEEWNAPKDKWQERVEMFLNAFQNESKTNRYDIGHSLNDMLMSCSFATKVCYAENFTQFQASEYGNCYTIESDKFTTKRTGPLYDTYFDGSFWLLNALDLFIVRPTSNGLWLTLNLEKTEYMTNFADAYGIKLIIHEPGTFPFPAEEGITINPNFETTIGLRMINISRQGQPYGNCDNGQDFMDHFGIRYTVPACVKLCKQRKVLEDCKCLPLDADIDIDKAEVKTGGSVRFCDPNIIQDFMCQEVINQKHDSGELDCFCNNPCEELVYEKTVSGRHWPNKDYMRYFLIHDLCKKGLQYNTDICAKYSQNVSGFNVEQYEDNFLRVIVYYEDLNYEMIKEDPLYDSFQFVSDIGGTLGLFIGASVLSLFEAVQLLLEILHFLKNKWTGQLKKTRVTDSMQDLTMPVNKNNAAVIQNTGIGHSVETFDINYVHESFKK